MCVLRLNPMDLKQIQIQFTIYPGPLADAPEPVVQQAPVIIVCINFCPIDTSRNIMVQINKGDNFYEII